MKNHNAFIARIVCLSFALLGLVHAGLALAQDKTVAPERWLTEPELDAKYRNCSDGFYGGPQEGKAQYTVDEYYWVVTPEFAKAFCMPERFIDKTLKGAVAIAYKPVQQPYVACGFGAKRTDCVRRLSHGFEIYFPSSLKLPSASQTKYSTNTYYQEVLPSARYLLKPNRKHDPNFAKDRAAWEAERPGTQAKFTDRSELIQRGGWSVVTSNGEKLITPLGRFNEIQYIEDLMPGYNYLYLVSSSVGFEDFPVERLASAGYKKFNLVLNRTTSKNELLKIEINGDFAHVIPLPERLIEHIKVTSRSSVRAVTPSDVQGRK